MKRGDIAAVGRSGWIDNPSDRGFWIALTAPGEAEGLPFDRTLCTHSQTLKCSGPEFGCVVEADALARWHNDLAQRWSWFITELRRQLPGVDVQFFKTYEPQARGALHIHAMMRASGVVTDRRFKAAVRLSARRWGFGTQVHCTGVDLRDTEAIAKRAGYAAKYSTKCSDLLPSVRRLDVQTGELKLGGMRSWSASWGYGLRMREIRLRRLLWATSAGAGLVPSRSGGPAGAVGALDSKQDFYAAGLVPVMVNPSAGVPVTV